MSDSDNDDIPPADECERRSQEFAKITGTDTALAMFYLQDRKWELDSALNAFFEEQGGTPVTAAAGAASTAKEEVDPEPHRIRVMSWNIDGLDQNNVKTRAKGVCHVIKQEKPDVVFLQEVVPHNLEVLESLLGEYLIIPADGNGYFTAMLLKMATVKYEEHSIQAFYASKMGRNLMVTQANVKGVDCQLMTSHLESTKTSADERKRQLKIALEKMRTGDSTKTIIFGGDLNLRDKELVEVGGLSENMVDVWEVTGRRPVAQYTWDLTKNDNLEWNMKFKPKCRFDRMYLRNSSPRKLKPVYFELIGIQRLPTCKRFCSDHWGILTHYDIV